MPLAAVRAAEVVVKSDVKHRGSSCLGPRTPLEGRRRRLSIAMRDSVVRAIARVELDISGGLRDSLTFWSVVGVGGCLEQRIPS
jgi:hypothetical protein